MRRKIRMALAALVTLALLAANACWAEPMPADDLTGDLIPRQDAAGSDAEAPTVQTNPLDAELVVGYVAAENARVNPFRCNERDLVSANQLVFEPLVTLDDARKPAPARLLGRATKSSASLKGIEGQAERAAQTAQTCLFCEKLDETMQRYVHTLIYMWKHETEFKHAFADSKGLCLEHYAQVMGAASEQLSGKELEEFIRTLTEVEQKNLERIEKEIEWFTLKFDYRNADKPWGNSQDAVERTLAKLRGYAAVEEEKREGE